MTAYRRSPNFTFKLIAAALVITFYFIISYFRGPLPKIQKARKPSLAPPFGARIQFEGWGNGTGKADDAKAQTVVEAMRYTFSKYKEHAWGYDDIKPVSGSGGNSRNGWGAFIVDTSTTLALMGLWEELELAVDHIVDTIDFGTAEGLVDPFETTIRYLGALGSLTDLVDAAIVPSDVVSKSKRDAILSQAVVLANKLAPAFDSPTGMIWPRVNFSTNQGSPDPPWIYLRNPQKPRYKNPSIGPARAGSSILENRVLSRLTGNVEYVKNATKAWAPLVWNKYIEEWPGMVDAPIDIFTGEPVGRQRHWDAGHDSYYEYLQKFAILASQDAYTRKYADRWTQAAQALRHFLVSRSTPTDQHLVQHLFMGKHDNGWYFNEMSHLACFAPGNLLLGGRFLNRPDLVVLGKALLETCHHTYASTPSGIGPELFSWIPMSGTANATFTPRSNRQRAELEQYGFFISDARYRLRPEYVESLFYAWRITGEQRYRDWAWDAFVAIERACKTKFGYAAVSDVTATGPQVQHEDESESFWGAETLKYLYLIFADTEVGSLDRWVYSTEGHPFRMIR